MQDATDVGNAHAAENRADDLPRGTLVDHYRLEGVLGRGGMGVVYRAVDTKLNRPVAIKFLSIDVADTRAKERFRQEASTASSLNHPHIVTVHDVGEHEGRQFIVSELVDGGTLDDWSSAARRGWRQCVEVVTGVADAVAAAHKAGVLHRDIKPGNILIGSNGYAKLTDFGLAKLVGSDAEGRRETTRHGVVVGTVAYMSPEQAAGQALDERSDVFSFGIVLYELLAGKRPFAGANDLETMKSIVDSSPAPLPGDVPELLRMTVDKALEKDPADRHQTMRDLVADLRRAARKSTSSQNAAQPSAAALSADNFFSRHRPAVLVALALVAAGAVYVFALRPTPPTPSTAGITASTHSITRLTTTGNAIAPAIAPDGRFVAYVQSDQSTGATSLWVRQIATASNVQIVAPEAGVVIGLPTVKPDGEYVDYVRWDAPGSGDLWRVSFLGGTPRLLAQDVHSPVSWSPDGQRMTFLRWSVRSTSLVVADADGGRERVIAERQAPSVFITNGTIGRPVLRPVWSPDGNTIAAMDFASDNQGERFRFHAVYVDVATGDEASSVVDGFVPQGLAWLSPTVLAVSQGRESVRAQIGRLSYPDGTLPPITNDLDSYYGLDVDASRRNLVTSRREAKTSLWVGDAAGANATQIVPPSPSETLWLPTLAWLGERVLFEKFVDGPPTVIAVDAGGIATDLVADAFEATASRDGRTVVFRRRRAGLFMTDAAGTRSVPLTEWSWSISDPRLTPDGRNVVFLSVGEDGKQSPWLLSTDGGEPTRLADDPIGFIGLIDLSPDGRHAMFLPSGTSQDALTVVLCELPACSNRREIYAPSGSRRPFHFMPDGAAIAYVDQIGTNLWALPLDGGSPRQITSFPASTAGGVIANYAWSNDGTRLAFARQTIAEDIVLFRDLQP